MTIIKQGGVDSKSHQRSLRAYINDDKKILLHDSQNVEECKDLKRWASYVERTHKTFGHDKTACRIRGRKAGELKKAKNTVLFHQIIALLPDECNLNGGKLTPEDCMRYARDYVGTYYPNQKVVFTLHNEYCKEDRTHRYAVHIAISCNDLSTGKRLGEGKGEEAEVHRASRIRKTDKTWGLKQVKCDERNSPVHKKQPSEVEEEIEERGEESYKMNLRKLCHFAADKAEDIYKYYEILEGWGVDTQFRKGRLYVTGTDNFRYSFSLAKLDTDLSANGLEERLLQNVEAGIEAKGTEIAKARAAVEAERQRVTDIRDVYLEGMRKTYLDYHRKAYGLEGTALVAFPELELKCPPRDVIDDPEAKRLWLVYRRDTDELHVEMVSEVPYARKPKKDGGISRFDTQSCRETPSMDKDERGHEQPDVH